MGVDFFFDPPCPPPCPICRILRSELDALTRELADIRDARHVTHAKQALDCLQRVMATLGKETTGPEATRVHNEARAFLVERGRMPAGLDEMRAAHAEWEKRR